jgi:hypothetical protein
MEAHGEHIPGRLRNTLVKLEVRVGEGVGIPGPAGQPALSKGEPNLS